uniref:Uncharacterized protein n=1 Tax=viral metagenome TaxID=1070528 RepID=A0A6M3X5T7_9ZZZZ
MGLSAVADRRKSVWAGKGTKCVICTKKNVGWCIITDKNYIMWFCSPMCVLIHFLHCGGITQGYIQKFLIEYFQLENVDIRKQIKEKLLKTLENIDISKEYKEEILECLEE